MTLMITGPDVNKLTNTYYRVTKQGRYVPRSILVDLEHSTFDQIKNGPCGRLYDPNNFVTSVNGVGTNNLWAKGHYTEGAAIIDEVIDTTRKEIEKCDCLHGFQMVFSLGGGTGSGLGTLIASKIREEYPDRMMTAFNVIPSTASDNIQEPYNTVLSMHQLIENMDMCFCVDNAAMSRICSNGLSASLKDFNELVARAMSGVTCNMRLGGEIMCDFRKMAVNLVSFPRLHFFTVSAAPIISYDKPTSVKELTDEVFRKENVLLSCDPRAGKQLTACAMFRGDVSTCNIEHYMQKRQDDDAKLFCDWLPCHIKPANCKAKYKDLFQSCVYIANTTAITSVFKSTLASFRSLFKRKAFLSPSLGEGMEEMEFTEAEWNLQDLVHEYQQYEEAT
eukprot:CAMPEP_0168528496 /NCGR_PEP_ID=MMETSP0405-20121227/13290_1 /TAXON_ID=498012 /ORGANISM="Trichosphaerium sp, Strain Am-I-7 wt" /LENGTH=390 /DNA_ID=CAMNT_0008551925 /DNA_START=124 /DNA_END=1293 /DNA_ORIENTATION=-